MKSSILIPVTAVLLTMSSVSPATIVDSRNWADEVEEYTSVIQNYGSVLMTSSTTWWLTGPPDASLAEDYVGGWRTDAPNEYIVMHWLTPLDDRPGDDLEMVLFSGPLAGADVLASVDGENYVNIGTIGGGVSGVFRTESFDFDGLLGDGITHIKVQRTANGPQSGIFFDAFGSVFLSPLIPGDANDDKTVDHLDAEALAQHWGDDHATWEMGDFTGDDLVNAADASILAANWGYTAESSEPVPEPSVWLLLTSAFYLFQQRRTKTTS